MRRSGHGRVPRQPDRFGGFDERRNTSRVFPVPEGALEDLLRTLERARDSGAEWYRWIANGCPKLTTDEYRAVGGWHVKTSKQKREKREQR